MLSFHYKTSFVVILTLKVINNWSIHLSCSPEVWTFIFDISHDWYYRHCLRLFSSSSSSSSFFFFSLFSSLYNSNVIRILLGSFLQLNFFSGIDRADINTISRPSISHHYSLQLLWKGGKEGRLNWCNINDELFIALRIYFRYNNQGR